MSDAVMISIKPHWCKEIFFGGKNVELRKTWPTKLELPFKAYVYCTAHEMTIMDAIDMSGRSQMIAGEIMVGRILEIDWYDGKSYVNGREMTAEDGIKTGVTERDFLKYKGNGRVYGWQICGHTFYKEPRPLSVYGMKRPPQSWCYVRNWSYAKETKET